MSAPNLLRPPEGRVWGALLWGAAVGVVVATAALWIWSVSTGGPKDDRAPPPPTGGLAVFRAPDAKGREMWVVRAGPDGGGEPSLHAALFPGAAEGEERLLAVLVANTSGDTTAGPFEADFAGSPLLVSEAGRADPRPAQTVASLVAAGACPRPGPAAEARLRGLGGTESAVSIPPGTLRQVLVALPDGMDVRRVTGVQWGGVPFLREEVPVERLRSFRLDPAGAARAR